MYAFFRLPEWIDLTTATQFAMGRRLPVRWPFTVEYVDSQPYLCDHEKRRLVSRLRINRPKIRNHDTWLRYVDSQISPMDQVDKLNEEYWKNRKPEEQQ